MKSGRSLLELAQEIQSQKERKQDLTISTDSITVVPTGDTANPVAFQVAAQGKFEGATLPIRPLALNQVAEHTKIPAVYAQRMAAEQPALLATNLNTWLHSGKPQRRLVRGLDGNARAFLSDRYQRIDNFDVANAALEALQKEFRGDLEIRSTEVTESRLYIKATIPAIRREIKSRRTGVIGRDGRQVGDIVEAGVMITNSEVGLGAVNVSKYAYELWCLNGAVREKSKRFNHVGSKIQGDEIGYLSDDTIQAGDRFDLLRIRDAIKNAFNEEDFDQYVARLQGATEDQIEAKHAVHAVEVLSNKLTLSKTEGASILEHLIAGGDLSRYGLFNAVTRSAEDVASYDRATELEAFGQKVIDLNDNEWSEVAQAA